MSWITIDLVGPSPSRKTRVWDISAADAEEVFVELGQIKWFARWRKYTFQPKPATVYEETCLREIADFCERMTREHKKGRAKPVPKEAV